MHQLAIYFRKQIDDFGAYYIRAKSLAEIEHQAHDSRCEPHHLQFFFYKPEVSNSDVAASNFKAFMLVISNSFLCPIWTGSQPGPEETRAGRNENVVEAFCSIVDQRVDHGRRA